MSLTLLDNAPLRAFGIFPLLEIELNGSFPLNLSGDGGVGWDTGGAGTGPFGSSGPVQVETLEAILDAPPCRWSTADLATSRGQYERVLLDWPDVELDTTLGVVAQMQCRLDNTNGQFNAWITRGEYRGKLAALHFATIDARTFRDTAIDLNRFVGALA